MKTFIQFFLLAKLLFLTIISHAQTPMFPPTPQFPQTAGQGIMPTPAYALNPYAQMPQQNPYNVPNNVRQESKPFNEFSGYLGIAVDTLTSAVSAQLPKGVTQGVLVKSFAPDSPAETTELKPYDVMFAYDDIKLNHPAQFIKIVRSDKPGREVIIKIVRKGGILEIPVTIGSQQTPNPKEYNGLAIKQISKDKYRAIVRYVGPSGNKQVRTYEGNREEIFEQAQNAQDLPQAERQQLLYATRPRKSNSSNGFGSFFPFGSNNSSGNNWMNPGKFFNW